MDPPPANPPARVGGPLANFTLVSAPADSRPTQALQASASSSRETKESRLAKMFNDEKFSDCVVQVGPVDGTKETFRVNRTVLARCSEVFGKMFFEDERREEVQIDDFSVPAFKELVRCAYDLIPEIHEENFAEVLRIARAYEVHELIEAVEDWMAAAELSPRLALRALDGALNAESRSGIENDLDELIEICLNVVANNFENLLDHGVLKGCSPKALITLVQRDNLCCDEESLWLALVAWDEIHQKPGVLQSLAPYLRYNVMRPAFFVDSVVPVGVLQPNEVVELLSSRTTRRPAASFPCAHIPRRPRGTPPIQARIKDDDDDSRSSSFERESSAGAGLVVHGGGVWGNNVVDPRMFVSVASLSSIASSSNAAGEHIAARATALSSARNNFKSRRDTTPVPTDKNKKRDRHSRGAG